METLTALADNSVLASFSTTAASAVCNAGTLRGLMLLLRFRLVSRGCFFKVTWLEEKCLQTSRARDSVNRYGAGHSSQQHPRRGTQGCNLRMEKRESSLTKVLGRYREPRKHRSRRPSTLRTALDKKWRIKPRKRANADREDLKVLGKKPRRSPDQKHEIWHPTGEAWTLQLRVPVPPTANLCSGDNGVGPEAAPRSG